LTSNYKSPRAEKDAMGIYDRSIANWPVPVDEVRVATALGETFVLAFGDSSRPPLVLLHGSAANSSTWGGEAAAYAREFRVYAIDLPGETGKSTPIRPPYAGTAYADWLGEVLDGLRLDRVHIAGLSLGGWAAMRFAASSPRRVKRVALIAPGGLAPAKKGFVLKALLYRPFGMWGIRRITNVVFSPDTPPPGAAEAFEFGLRNYNARRDNLPLVTDDELKSLTMPVFFVGGDQDALLDTNAGAERLRLLVPHSETTVLERRGHALLGAAAEVLTFLTSAPYCEPVGSREPVSRVRR
jgi:pimeloyl-ACP methyl ester carboxylesterase